MRVLVACEFSGTVRDAFIRRGHFAMSCDFRPSETSGEHYQGDVRDVLDEGWDLMVAHPPCTYLTNAGVRWLTDPAAKHEARWKDMIEAADFYRTLRDADIPRKAIENPIMHRYAETIIRRGHCQTVQPFHFGVYETKAAVLELVGLPDLTKTYPNAEACRSALGIPEGQKPHAKCHRMPPGPEREKERSRFPRAIAEAMADQWGREAAVAA